MSGMRGVIPLKALRGRPEWFNDWVEYCAVRVRGAVAAGLEVPSQHRLEALFGEFQWQLNREGEF